MQAGTHTHHHPSHTHMEAEFSAVMMVRQAEHRSCAIPEGSATIGVTLVFLEQFEVLHEDDAITHNVDPYLP